MSTFDPSRHRVVAVPYRDDDPERGQHFHVDLATLIQAARDAAANAVVPHQSGAVVAVPQFETSKIAQLESRVTELTAMIDDLAARPTFTGSDLESLRAAVSGRIREVVRDEVKLALTEQDITTEVRELRERIERADSPSELMKAVSKLTADSAEIAEIIHGEIMRLRESVAGMEQNFQSHIEAIETEFHQHLAGGLQAAHDAIRAASEYRVSSRLEKRSA